MSRIWAGILGFLALLAFAAAALALMVLPDQLAEFQREPEDVYLAVFWAIVCFLMSVFMAAAAIRSYRGPRENRTRDYIASALSSGIGLLLIIMGSFSTLDAIWLIPAGLLCIGVGFAYLRRSRPAH
jgi:drug/metabolite transporter (DMT)-like permease